MAWDDSKEPGHSDHILAEKWSLSSVARVASLVARTGICSCVSYRVELFNGSPPQLFFIGIAGFEATPPAVCPEVRCALPPRRRRSMSPLQTRKRVKVFFHSILPSSSHDVKKKKNGWILGGAMVESV